MEKDIGGDRPGPNKRKPRNTKTVHNELLNQLKISITYDLSNGHSSVGFQFPYGEDHIKKKEICDGVADFILNMHTEAFFASVLIGLADHGLVNGTKREVQYITEIIMKNLFNETDGPVEESPAVSPTDAFIYRNHRNE